MELPLVAARYLNSDWLSCFKKRTKLHFMIMVPNIQLVRRQQRDEIHLCCESGKLVSNLLLSV
jgi:hypothetical protein